MPNSPSTASSTSRASSLERTSVDARRLRARDARRLTWAMRAAWGAVIGVAIVPTFASADIFTYTDASGAVHVTNKRKAGSGGGKVIKSPDVKKKTHHGVAIGSFEPHMPRDKSPERLTRYDPWIRQAAALYQLPEALVRAVMKVESDFDPRATSHVGAQGLMQLMPATALRMQVRDSMDPRENIFGGTRYLRFLANTFNGNLELTIAAYNAGEGAVTRYGGVPPYPETQNYVVQVLSHYRAFKMARAASSQR